MTWFNFWSFRDHPTWRVQAGEYFLRNLYVSVSSFRNFTFVFSAYEVKAERPFVGSKSRRSQQKSFFFFGLKLWILRVTSCLVRTLMFLHWRVHAKHTDSCRLSGLTASIAWIDLAVSNKMSAFFIAVPMTAYIEVIFLCSAWRK